MHITSTTAWHETGLRLHLYRADDPTRYDAGGKGKGIGLEVHNLNPEVTTTHVFTRWGLFRVAAWMMWRSVIGVKS